MHEQSTAPLSRRARQAYTLMAASAVILLGTGIGVMAYGALMEPDVLLQYRGAAEPMPVPRATATNRPVDMPSKAIGTVGSLVAGTMLWIDDTGLFAYNRADANRDSKGTSAALRLWDHFSLPARTSAMITNRRADMFQLEVLEGPLAGRRGWTDQLPYWRTDQ